MKTLTIDQTDDAFVVEDETGTQIESAGTDAAVVVDEEGGDQPKKAKLPDRAVRNDDGTITLPLLKPVTMTIKNATGQRQETYKELTFQEMTGLNLRLIAQAPAEQQTVVALAQATSMPLVRMNALFDRMLARDVAAAAAIISFLQE